MIEKCDIEGLRVISPTKHKDDRGLFSETYNRRAFEQEGICADFVQDNHSISVHRGVVRGLHFQLPPHGQGKLVRVIRGRILDVAVDLRKNSVTFGQHYSIELSSDNWLQLYIPVGFAHGFCTLTEHTEVIYKVTDFYAPDHDAGLRWNDPRLGIQWPVSEGIKVSEKDSKLPYFEDFVSPFS